MAVALQLLLLLAVTVNLNPPALLLLNVAGLVLLTNVPPPLLAQLYVSPTGPVLGDKPAEFGLGGLALNSKVWPVQILELAGLMLTVGFSLTRTVAVAVALQLLLLVAVTVTVKVPLLPLLHDTGLPVLLTKLPPLLAQV